MPRPANALIIDDEIHVRVLLTAILKQLGIRTIWDAADGRTGLVQAALHKPDIVLLDLNLPEVSGIDVLEKLKADNPAMPVIVVSAQSTVRTIARVKELGANGYVIKYAPKSEVIQMLSDALDAVAGEPASKPAEDVERQGE
jgi:two-component system KDP operon response regulator KdpE